MTKAQEIEWFDAVAANTPSDSYLRMYFTDPAVREAFLYALRSDLQLDLAGVNRAAAELHEKIIEEERILRKLREEQALVRESFLTLARLGAHLSKQVEDAAASARAMQATTLNFTQNLTELAQKHAGKNA